MLNECVDEYSQHGSDGLQRDLFLKVYGETSFELIEQMVNSIDFKEEDMFIDLGSGKVVFS